MTFVETILGRSKQLWDDAADCGFLREMERGTLSDEKLLAYIVQDSLYLRDFLKTFAYGITKSATLGQMQAFYELLGMISDGENVTRLDILREHGLSDADLDAMPKMPECEAYTAFLLDWGRRGTLPEILMATMPCMWGYNYVFTRVRDRTPAVMNGKFARIVGDYVCESFAGYCGQWKATAERWCGDLDAATQQHLSDIFMEASRHELWFWQMASGER